ncbi:MAG TPA: hypothetical protein VFV19_19290 [Candidatus Polarisedimenticolaceae bacterium]|nr:hypothetical protein [Candidatus Polarisedimenticolaceae bacterium]
MKLRPVLAAVAIAAGVFATARAQDERPAAEQMRRLFAARLKADVGLDDTQVATVLPKIEALEKARRDTGRERRRLVRELRQGIESGMPDADLQQRLDALDRLGQEGERSTRAGLQEVDRDLTVPQRVRLRFLLVQFRDEMRRSIQDAGGIHRQRRSPPAGPPP